MLFLLLAYLGVNNFFAPLSDVNYEKQYWAVWDQIFQLKQYCNLSLDEQRLMTAEERVWYINRYNHEMEKREEERRKMKNR